MNKIFFRVYESMFFHLQEFYQNIKVCKECEFYSTTTRCFIRLQSLDILSKLDIWERQISKNSKNKQAQQTNILKTDNYTHITDTRQTYTQARVPIESVLD